MNVDDWLKEVEKHCGTEVSIIVLANKVDIAEKKPRNEDNEEDDQEREIEVTDEDIA